MSMKTRSAYFKYREPGYLNITGPDRIPFLQRQTTNDIEVLTAGQPVVTVLTSPTGRILDVLWVIDEGDETLGVLTLPGQGDKTARFLNERIFFMDKVTLEDRSADLLQLEILGEGRANLLQDLGVESGYGGERYIAANLASAPVRLLVHEDFSCRLLTQKAHENELRAYLEMRNFVPITPGEYEILRIEKGIPAAGHELVEEYTPLEVGYRWAISENKGCYTGQEVIARQINYDKVTRQLVGLLIDGEAELGDTLYLQANAQPQGKITSLATSPGFGAIGLAVIKRPHHQAGTKLTISHGDKSIQALTTALPFEKV